MVAAAGGGPEARRASASSAASGTELRCIGERIGAPAARQAWWRGGEKQARAGLHPRRRVGGVAQRVACPPSSPSGGGEAG